MNAALPLAAYLRPGTYTDSDHPDVIAYAHAHTRPEQTLQEKAVALFYAVRDGFRYNPYVLHFGKEDLKASTVLHRKDGHCVDKANVYATACRAVGIPSRLHFANVCNHIGTSKLEGFLKTNVLAFHGYAEICLNDRWVVVTPTFNKELCARLGVEPLEFDGENDALFQEYATADTESGPRRFMEYLHDHGHDPDLPRDRFIAAMHDHYGHLFTEENLAEIGMQIVF